MTIRVNGRELTADEIEPMLAAPAADFARIDFVTTEPHDMVLEILRQARGALAESDDVRRRVADQIAAGRVAEAMRELGDCLAVWGTTHEAVTKSAELLQIELNSMQVDGRSAMERMGRVADQLRGLRDALSAGDLVLTTDILRYDMAETLAEWERVLAGLAGHVVVRAPVGV